MSAVRFALLARSRAHLAAAGESYARHFRFAATTGALMVLGGLIALLHAIVPGLLTDRASRTLRALEAGLDRRSTAEAEAVLGGDAIGLLTFLLLCLLAATLPWAAMSDVPLAAALSLLAVGMPLAALRGLGDEQDLETDDPPGWSTAPADDHVAIVGGGFSGTMLAVQLARLGEMRVTLIERSVPAGRGVAYSTDHAGHLLNVRAAKMSAFPDDPDHFVRWLGARGRGGPADFVARRDYGDYLQELLREAEASAGGLLKVVRGEAVDVESAGGGAVLRLADGRSLSAGRVVLASGNLPPRPLGLLAGAGLPQHVTRCDPWSGDLAEGLNADDIVLLVGTGLTMVDTAVALADAGFGGRIVAVSRRGLLPRVHAAAAVPEIAPPSAGQPVSRLLRAVRRNAESAGWRETIDALRPHMASLWRAAGEAERGRFLRHLRPWWDVHRHRIAPAVADRIAALRKEGRLELVAGRIVAAARSGDAAEIRIQLRGTRYRRTVVAARIVACTGADCDLDGIDDPLLATLAARGAIRPDAHRLGIDVDEHGAALGADGTASPVLSVIGPLARGRDWEATAVPELRVHAEAMARRLSLPHPVSTIFG